MDFYHLFQNDLGPIDSESSFKIVSKNGHICLITPNTSQFVDSENQHFAGSSASNLA